MTLKLMSENYNMYARTRTHTHTHTHTHTQQHLLVFCVFVIAPCVRDLLPVLHPEALLVFALGSCKVALKRDWWAVVTHG